MKKGVFVTGTDTGVGKTMVSAALLQILRAAGVDAVPMKPVQTGCVRRGRTLSAPDLDLELAAVRMSPDPVEYAEMAPYRFKPACSPHLAAHLAGETISLGRIAGSYRQLAGSHEIVVVEGAGGVLVPLTDRVTMLDLMKRLGLPVILVARPGLGTINHTLLSLRELRRAGLSIMGVVFNHSQRGGEKYIEDDNRRIIDALGRPGRTWVMPYAANFGSRRVFAGLPAAIEILEALGDA